MASAVAQAYDGDLKVEPPGRVQESGPPSRLQQDDPQYSRKPELFGWAKEGEGAGVRKAKPQLKVF